MLAKIVSINKDRLESIFAGGEGWFDCPSGQPVELNDVTFRLIDDVSDNMPTQDAPPRPLLRMPKGGLLPVFDRRAAGF